jgi:transposase
VDSALHRSSLAEQLRGIDQVVDESIKAIEVGEQSQEPGFAMPQAMRDDKQRKEKIIEALARLDAEDTNHLHPQDAEARVMKSRQGTILGYDAQAVVDHDSDLIVAGDVVSDEFDSAQLVPMIDQVLHNAGEVAEATSADGGYFSGEQIDEAQRRHLPIIINTPEDSTEKGDFKKAFFRYDEDQDCYICPQGKTLNFWRIEQPSKGKLHPRRVYRCTQRDCPQSEPCSKNKAGRTIKRTPFEPSVERQKQLQDNPAAQILLGLRKEIIEHTFGNIKHNHGFRRFTVRTIEAVRAQWSLMCTAINLLKLYAFWRQGRLPLVA